MLRIAYFPQIAFVQASCDVFTGSANPACPRGFISMVQGKGLYNCVNRTGLPKPCQTKVSDNSQFEKISNHDYENIPSTSKKGLEKLQF